MPERIEIFCDHCDASLKLKNRNSVGRLVPCPKCGERFRVEIPAEDNYADEWESEHNAYETDYSFDDYEDGQSKSRRRSASSSRSAGRSGRRRPSKKGKPQVNVPLIAGISIGCLAVVGLVVFLASGKTQQDDLNQSGSVGSTVDESGSPEATSGHPVTEAEVAELGRKFAEHLSSGSAATAVQFLDLDLLTARIVGGLIDDPGEIRDFKTGFEKTIQRHDSLLGQLATMGNNGATISFQHVVTVDGQQRALIRLLHPNGGMNFLELVPARSTVQSVRIADIYAYMSGELISATTRQTIIPMIAGRNRSLLERLTGVEREAAEFAQQLIRVTQARQRGDNNQTIQLTKSLSPSLRKLKSVLLLRLQAAQTLDNQAEYIGVMETFRNEYPNDPALDLLLLDYFAVREDKKSLVDSLERLYTRTQGDAHLGSMLAENLLGSGNAERAASVIVEVMEKEPNLQNGLFAAFQLQAHLGDYDGCLATLKKTFRLHELYFEDSAEFRGLGKGVAGFADSPQGAEYQVFVQKALTGGLATVGELDFSGSEWSLPEPVFAQSVWLGDLPAEQPVAPGFQAARDACDRADSLKVAGQYDQAAMVYNQALQLAPEWAYPAYQLACNWMLAGREDDANEAFRRALDLKFSKFLMASVDDELGSIREQPEFEDQMRGIHERYVVEIQNSPTPSPIAVKPSGEKPASGWPTILLLHGFGDSHLSYIPEAEGWSKAGFLSVAVPGTYLMNLDNYAWSTTSLDPTSQQLAAILDSSILKEEIDQDRVFLLGFSQGALHALTLMAREPDRYLGVIAISPGGTPVSPLINPTIAEGSRKNRLMFISGIQEGLMPVISRWNLPIAQAHWMTRPSFHTGGHHFPDDWQDSGRDKAVQFLIR